MKIKRFLLNENTCKFGLQYLDLVTFEKEIEYSDVAHAIYNNTEKRVINKEIESYYYEDVIGALDTLGIKYTIDYIGNLDLYEY